MHLCHLRLLRIKNASSVGKWRVETTLYTLLTVTAGPTTHLDELILFVVYTIQNEKTKNIG